jgi:hypothetical protein
MVESLAAKGSTEGSIPIPLSASLFKAVYSPGKLVGSSCAKLDQASTWKNLSKIVNGKDCI